jgi:hypothetical protein
MEINFPHYHWRARFAAFNCGPQALLTDARLAHIKELAVKEQV